MFIDELVGSRYFFPLVFGTQLLTGVALLTGAPACPCGNDSGADIVNIVRTFA